MIEYSEFSNRLSLELFGSPYYKLDNGQKERIDIEFDVYKQEEHMGFVKYFIVAVFMILFYIVIVPRIIL